jgi:hypothetical protein
LLQSNFSPTLLGVFPQKFALDFGFGVIEGSVRELMNQNPEAGVIVVKDV